jgi:hypothetical protein
MPMQQWMRKIHRLPTQNQEGGKGKRQGFLDGGRKHDGSRGWK